jgi:hypothetical protein
MAPALGALATGRVHQHALSILLLISIHREIVVVNISQWLMKREKNSRRPFSTVSTRRMSLEIYERDDIGNRNTYVRFHGFDGPDVI